MAAQLGGGHKETILCVTTTNDGRLVSGGDNGELCIWPLDGAAPQMQEVDTNDITSICCPKSNTHDLYVASGQKVLRFDMRQMSQPLHTFDHNEDEINQIALHEKEDYLAACDDSGQIKIFNLQTKQVYKTLRKHTNICSSVAFRPNRPWDLLSAGMDCNLLQWDFSKNRAYCSVDMTELRSDDDDVESYLVNPPFIYSMHLSPNGTRLACGLENALVQVFDSSKRTVAFMCTLRGHTSGVSQVHFPNFTDQLITAGNDGHIFFWDIKDCAPRMTNGHATDHHANGHANGHPPADVQVANQSTSISPRRLIQHGDKINWMTSVEHNGQKTVVIADNTSNLTLYPLTE